VFDDGAVNVTETPSPLNQFMMDYKFPTIMSDFIHHFIVSDKIDTSKLRDGVYILDESEMLASGGLSPEQNFKDYVTDQDYMKYVHVTLAIPVDATSTQITDSLALHKDFIKHRQESVRGFKKTYKQPHLMAGRDTMLLNLSREGYKPREIAQLITGKWSGLSGPQIAKILYRIKKNRP
jgi:hypothetical protein